MQRTVTLIQDGREARVTYTEGLRSITGHQEFGGEDIVAIVSMGSVQGWRVSHAWALGRRSGILGFVAAELVRQQSPSSFAEIDEESGDILLRESGAGRFAPPAAISDSTWVRRFGELRAQLGLIVLLAVLAFGAGIWIKNRLLAPQAETPNPARTGAG